MIYLDNGATSLPKPEAVGRAMLWALEHLPSPGRGSSSGAEAAEELLFALRLEAASQFHCQPEQVILTTSCTHGLNIALKSLAGPGDRVVISCVEHNAVVRPLYAIGADIHVAGKKLFDSAAFLEELDQLLTPDTRLCADSCFQRVWLDPSGGGSGRPLLGAAYTVSFGRSAVCWNASH